MPTDEKPVPVYRVTFDLMSDATWTVSIPYPFGDGRMAFCPGFKSVAASIEYVRIIHDARARAETSGTGRGGAMTTTRFDHVVRTSVVTVETWNEMVSFVNERSAGLPALEQATQGEELAPHWGYLTERLATLCAHDLSTPDEWLGGIPTAEKFNELVDCLNELAEEHG